MAKDDDTDAQTGDDVQTLATGALTSQADLDKLIATRFSAVPLAVLKQRTDWNGLTREQEAEQLWQKHQQEAQALEEYDEEMSDVRNRADRLMEQLDEREREIRKKLAQADARAIVLHDGRRVLVGDGGEYVDEATGDRLEGSDKAEAQSLRKSDSETVSERKKLTDDLALNERAKEHLLKAKAISQTDPTNLSPEQMKQNETEAQDELALAEEKNNKLVDFDNTDTLSALGLTQGRTASFAGTIDGKDDRSTALQNEFTTCAVGPDGSKAGNDPACSTPSGSISKKTATQPNQ